MISEEGLKRFIGLYKKKYTIKLGRQEAFNIFSQLINLVKLAYGVPSPSFAEQGHDGIIHVAHPTE